MAEYKRLLRSKTDKRIGGVCGGLGEYFGVDPVPIRVVWVFCCFFGIGILLYFLAWIIIPEA